MKLWSFIYVICWYGFFSSRGGGGHNNDCNKDELKLKQSQSPLVLQNQRGVTQSALFVGWGGWIPPDSFCWLAIGFGWLSHYSLSIFCQKMCKNKKCAHRFPENTKPHGINTSHEERVQFANTERMKNSPVMQKLLNLNEQNQDKPYPDD